MSTTIRTYEKWFIRFESSTWGWYRTEQEALEATRYSTRPFTIERETWEHAVRSGSRLDDIIRMAPQNGGATPIATRIVPDGRPVDGLTRCVCGAKYWDERRLWFRKPVPGGGLHPEVGYACHSCGEPWRPEGGR